MRPAVAAAALLPLVAIGCGSSGGRHPATPATTATRTVANKPVSHRALAAAGAAARGADRQLRRERTQPYTIGSVTVKLTDPSRTIGGRPRSFDTIIRYPKVAAGQASGPFPLIVFGHGFSVTPEP
jgi:hypothetical protein